MLVYLVKFSACLAIFMVFYKLFLERENMHHIKRYYLLSALILSIGIPLVTFIQYIEPTVTESFIQPMDNFVTSTAIEDVPVPTDYTTIILWSIYCLGFIIFGLKFSLNLFQIFKKIKRNPKFKNQNFVNVLLTDLITPHTFFSYIFLNKHKYEAQEIPEEVFIHEQTHANQKHSIDVLFIELLQVLFWFNPLLYFIKKDIKLNHEFLADQAVLKNGIQSSDYQNLLLTFSSNVSEPNLANAINYSSIKKRFTVMKTQTSKQKIWLRSSLLLPLVALTLYGFSETKEVIKPSEDLKVSNSDNTARSISIEILEDGTYTIDGITATESTLLTEVNKLHQDITSETRNNIMNIHVTSSSEISNEEVWFIYNSLLDYGFYRMVAGDQEIVKGKGNTPFAIEQTQQKATAEEVAEYNKIAKHCNSQIETKSFIIKQKDVKRLEQLYAKMSSDQKNVAEPYPDFSNFPPLPPPATGFINVNGETLFVIYYSPKRYYNKKGYLVDKNGSTINGNIQVNASDVLPGQYITKVYQNDKVVVEFNDNMQKQQQATAEEVAEYNKLASQHNDKPERQRIYKQKDVERMEYIYKKMSKEQKANAEPFPNFPPPPPPPPAPAQKKQNPPTQVEIDAYNTWAKKIHSESTTLSGNATLLPIVGEQDLIKFSEIYNRMSLQQKNQSVKFPFPGLNVKENEHNSPLVPPPPPPAPIAPLDHVIEMAKKGAAFYYEGKSISSDEAIKLLKKNDELNLSIKQIDSKEPKVYIMKDPIKINNPKKQTGLIGTEGIPKPTSKNAVNHLKVMNRHGAKFYLNDKKVSFAKALEAIKKNKYADINSTFEPPVVRISNKLVGVLGQK